MFYCAHRRTVRAPDREDCFAFPVLDAAVEHLDGLDCGAVRPRSTQLFAEQRRDIERALARGWLRKVSRSVLQLVHHRFADQLRLSGEMAMSGFRASRPAGKPRRMM